MGFWRNEVIEFATGYETRFQIEEQLRWIGREPDNPRPYFNLAQLYRMQGRREEGLALLLEAVRLDATFAEAHISLTEVYSVNGDYRAAWRHARAAERYGNRGGVELLTRHRIEEG